MILEKFLFEINKVLYFDSVFIIKSLDSGGYRYSFGDYLKDSLKKQTKNNELLTQDYFRKFL